MENRMEKQNGYEVGFIGRIYKINSPETGMVSNEPSSLSLTTPPKP